MKSIIVATDLSERGTRAIERAVALARRDGAALLVVHVVDGDLPERIACRRRDEAEETIAARLGNIAGSDGIEMQTRIVLGSAAPEILREADRAKADLIVLGLHRARAIADLFVGTTVERVVRLGDRPVLTVRDAFHKDYETILFAVDFSIYSRRALEFGARFAAGAAVYVLHVYDVPYGGLLGALGSRSGTDGAINAGFEAEADRELIGLLAGSGLDVPPPARLLKRGEPRVAIRAEAARLKPDLLVVGTHGRTGVARALLGSVAGDLLNDPPCDVLTIGAW